MTQKKDSKYYGRAARRIVVVVMALLAVSLGSVHAANADPVVGQGCKSHDVKEKYQFGGATAYGIEMSFRFCWTTGGSSSRILHISGDASSWSNAIFQTQGTKGPTNSAKVPIRYAYVSSTNQSTIYFWFQSRDCATGPLNVICAPWSTHRLVVRLYSGGHYAFVSRS